MFRQLGPAELVIILLIVVLLFGAKKLPETARGLGRSLRIFKAETKALNDDDSEDEPAAPKAPKAVEASRIEPAEQHVAPTPETERTDR